MDRAVLHVIAAAIIGKDGRPYSLPPPAGHYDVINHMLCELRHPIPIDGEQGFILSDGTFSPRCQAYRIAKAAGQLLHREPWQCYGEVLFSGDVW